MNIDEVMDKIRKVVRLANRTNEQGERETALRLAKGLAEKNGISFEDIESTECDCDKTVHEMEDEYHSCDGVELGHICYILQQHFGVILMLHTVRGKSWKARKSWFGSHLNIDIAKHIYHILMRESRKAYSEECRKNSIENPKVTALEEALRSFGYSDKNIRNEVAKLKRHNINRKSFMAGFFFAIDKKLKENPLRNDLDIYRKEAEKKLDEFRKDNVVKQSTSRRNKNPDQSAINAGFEAGSKMNLARPCEGEDFSPLAIAL